MTMHKGLRKFQIEAKINDDSDFIRIREVQEKLLVDQMRELGYIPVIDLGPFWATSFDDKEHYDSVLTMYGMRVGKKEVKKWYGVDGAGTMYPQQSTQRDKSNQSSDHAE